MEEIKIIVCVLLLGVVFWLYLLNVAKQTQGRVKEAEELGMDSSVLCGRIAFTQDEITKFKEGKQL